MSKNKDGLHALSKAVRIQTPRTWQMEHSTPLYLTSSFTFEQAEEMKGAFADENDENIYSRFSNPNTDEFVEKCVPLKVLKQGLPLPQVWLPCSLPYLHCLSRAITSYAV